MTYGDHLGSAAAALARSYAALRTAAPDPAERASVPVSRAGIYRSLEQHVLGFGGVEPAELPPPTREPVPHQWRPVHRDPVTDLAIGLRLATIQAGQTSPPAAGPVAAALSDAWRSLQAAGDVLVSNTGPATAPHAARHALTSEGMAVLAGAGRQDNLAVVARLAGAAAAMDRRLAGWLGVGTVADLEPLVAAAERDAWHTGHSTLHETARLVAAAGDPRQAPALGMTVAPPIDDPRRWTHPTSGAACVTAIDAARSWLTRHPGEITVDQLATTARAALALTHYLGHIHTHTAAADTLVTAEVRAAARPWLAALRAVADLRSPVPAHLDHSTLTVATTAAADWLRGHLRPDGQWREPLFWAPNPATRTAWRDTGEQLLARLPDLAELLHEAIGTSRTHGNVLAPITTPPATPGHQTHSPQWTSVTASHAGYKALRAALRRAAANTRELADVLSVVPRPGLADIHPAQRVAPTAAGLAASWYPQPDGVAEVTPPAASTDGRPRHTRPATRGRAR
jgi:hypothetical protein